MKKRTAALVVLLLAGLFLATGSASAAVAKLTKYRGRVFIVRAGNTLTPYAYFPLEEKDIVLTRRGHATIRFDAAADDTEIQLRPNSKLEIEEGKESKRSLNVFFGRLWARVVRAKENPTQFRTGRTIAAIRGTTLEYGVNTDGSVDVGFIEGAHGDIVITTRLSDGSRVTMRIEPGRMQRVPVRGRPGGSSPFRQGDIAGRGEETPALLPPKIELQNVNAIAGNNPFSRTDPTSPVDVSAPPVPSPTPTPTPPETPDGPGGQGGSGGATCADKGESCATIPCCEGLTCDPETLVCCYDVGLACEADEDCCSGICLNGVCDPGCSELSELCPRLGGTLYPPCCEPLVCDFETSRCCVAEGEPCEAIFQCCFGFDCVNGVCELGCKQVRESCDRNIQECCAGLFCIEECCAVTGTRCQADADCCHGVVAGGQVFPQRCDGSTSKCCVYGGLPCTSNAECCQDQPGMGCNFSPSLGREACCVQDGSGCQSDRDCCSGRCLDNHCDPCVQNGQTCGGNWDCCSGFCDDGRCSPCADVGASCGFDAECCSGICRNRVCECLVQNEPCQRDAECCAGSCFNGHCLCGADGSGCQFDYDCCSGNCVAGICEPVQAQLQLGGKTPSDLRKRRPLDRSHQPGYRPQPKRDTE